MKEELLEFWNRRFGRVPELGLPGDAFEVRVHSLPGDVRYPRHRGHWATLLERHNEVLTHVLGAGEPYVLILTEYGERDVAHGGLAPLLSMPHEELRTVHDEYEGRRYVAYNLFIAALSWHRGSRDEILRAIADNRLSNVFFVSLERGEVVRPYDGGLDYFGRDGAAAEAFQSRFEGWLPGACPPEDPLEIVRFAVEEERPALRRLAEIGARLWLDATDRCAFVDLAQELATDLVLADVDSLTALEELRVGQSPVAVPPVGPQSPPPMDSSLTDRGLAHLVTLRKLDNLRIGACPRVTDRGLAHLAKLSSLGGLAIEGCPGVTDRGLGHLAALSNLRSLELSSCPSVSASAISALREALPDCEIWVQGKETPPQ